MEPRRRVEVPLEHPDRGRIGTLVLRVPPGREGDGRRPPLVDARGDPERGADTPRFQLLESEEYHYELTGLPADAVPLALRPEKLVFPDPDGDRRGRLRPGLHTGVLPLRVEAAGGRELGRARLEVRSRKLGYREHYRWMLGDLAEGMAELVMQRFAPTRQRFGLDETLEAPTLYQRFAFLRSLVESQVFDGAIQHVLRRPYRTWTTEEERRRPGRGVPATSAVARQLAGPGPRTDAGRLEEALGMETVPRTLRVARTEETRDNVPNRFVRFALERWRGVVARIHELLEDAEPSGPVHRGLRECRALRNRLDAVLARELFRACGPLESFPAGNQVLHKREGYRDIFRAWVQFEAAARLAWEGGEDVYGAGQRDVATLYEYWVYWALGREISDLCDEPFAFADLVEPTDDGLELKLRRGAGRVLSGTVRRLGRDLDVQLWFNRTFSGRSEGGWSEGRWSGDGGAAGRRAGRGTSWTSDMRPDLSVRIGPSGPDAAFFHEEVWLHFDAKYRLEEAPGGGEDGAGEPEDDEAGAAGREPGALQGDLWRGPETEGAGEGQVGSAGQAAAEPGAGSGAGDDGPEGQRSGDAPGTDDGDYGAGAEYEGGEAGNEAEAKRSDLLKMHAYRDAIRRSSGAYVIYPGTDRVEHRQYREILPGLGAFPLRPTPGGPPEGAAGVRRFVDEVLDQVALQTSEHERARYWLEESYGAGQDADADVRAAPFLEEPPADAEVLLGWVKSAAQHRWIRREGLYNLRADDRTGSVDVGSDELGARYLVLYGTASGLDGLPEVWRVTGEPRLLDREDMIDRGYPGPGGEMYFCLRLGGRRSYPPVEAADVRRLVALHRQRGAGPTGAPLVVSWLELVEGVG